MSGGWTWRREGGASGAAPSFPSQADAEAWLAEEWAVLADEGVTAVTLLEGDRVVYGPMSLEPG